MSPRIAAMLLAALAVASPSFGQTVPTAATANNAEHDKLAYELVRLLNSEEAYRAQAAKMLNDTLPKTLPASPDFAGLERDHPGITKAIIEAMRPVLVEGSVVTLPSLWARLAPLYARTFTTVELHQLLDFYASPVGMRLLKAMSEGADFSRMLGDAIAREDGTITADGVHAGIQSGAMSVVRTAAPEDINALMAFAATDAGKKARLLAPKIEAETAAWGNKPDPALDARVEAAVLHAVEDYIGKSKT